MLVLEGGKKCGEKIRISGGGRCNFTNLNAAPENYLSSNPRFCISALKRYTPWDFIGLLEKHGVDWHEKAQGQLFCDDSAQQIVELLLDECRAAGARIERQRPVTRVQRSENGFLVQAGGETYAARALVVATGGKSIPKMGATGLAFTIAKQFGLNVIEPRAGLVPFTFHPADLEPLKPLAGISVEAEARCASAHYADALLFTHRGVSGPVILQLSSHWTPGEAIEINLLPGVDLAAQLIAAKRDAPKQTLGGFLTQHLPKRVARHLAAPFGVDARLADQPDKRLRELAQSIQAWRIVPSGTEGYRTAEVTVGGVDVDAIDSRSMMCREIDGLYFIGEALDVTGELGGYNFQWAWASGHAAGMDL
ncbi:putative oxidoreductase [Magnetofaba australis IT-1]|uniref:Putative oxidoreductase n=1 Tax=Magnetofaba australis IT-1 TaxID=1434232 RepID=A0A1Y2K243_9PROT|nr:putative oxidoreductase [Magnetofaba australis IT-1]